MNSNGVDRKGMSSARGWGFCLCLGAVLAAVTATGRAMAEGGSPVQPRETPTAWFAATNGQTIAAGGLGTWEQPWDLATALTRGGAIPGGDTLWILGGTYRHPDRTGGGLFPIVLTGGLPDAPITIRNYDGQRVTIDGGLLSNDANNRHLRIWGLEVMVAEKAAMPPPRVSDDAGSTLPGPGGGITITYGHDIKLINNVIHACGTGINFWAPVGGGSEMHGNLIYDHGWIGVTRSHGPGIYTQNRLDNNDTRLIGGNLIFDNYSLPLQIYGSAAAHVHNFLVRENILSVRAGSDRNFALLGGVGFCSNLVALQNACYGIDLHIGWFEATNGAALSAISNTLYRGDIVTNPAIADVTLTDNALWNPGDPVPAAPLVFVYPNAYEAKRAHVAVFSWDVPATVPVDLGGFLQVGDTFALRNPTDFYGMPVLEGTYTGEPVDVSVNAEFTRLVVMGEDPPDTTTTTTTESTSTTTTTTTESTSTTTTAADLVGHWTLDETEGLTAFDSSGNGNHGALEGDMNADHWAPGRVDGAVQFNGGSNVVTVGNLALLKPTNTITVAAWVLWAPAPHDSAYPFAVSTRGASAGYVFGDTHPSLDQYFYFTIQTTGGGTRNTYVNPFPRNAWQHVAGTYDGENVRLYVNGALVPNAGENVGTRAATGPIVYDTTPLQFGGGGMKGRVDDVRIYDRALSAAEVEALYTDAPPPPVRTYYVRTNGLDIAYGLTPDGAGVQGPKRGVLDAYTFALDGDTVDIGAGEFVIAQSSGTGLELNKRVDLRGAGSSKTTLRAPNASGRMLLLKPTASGTNVDSRTTLSGLRLDAVNPTSYGIAFDFNVAHVRFEDIDFHPSSFSWQMASIQPPGYWMTDIYLKDFNLSGGTSWIKTHDGNQEPFQLREWTFDGGVWSNLASSLFPRVDTLALRDLTVKGGFAFVENSFSFFESSAKDLSLQFDAVGGAGGRFVFENATFRDNRGVDTGAGVDLRNLMTAGEVVVSNCVFANTAAGYTQTVGIVASAQVGVNLGMMRFIGGVWTGLVAGVVIEDDGATQDYPIELKDIHFGNLATGLVITGLVGNLWYICPEQSGATIDAGGVVVSGGRKTYYGDINLDGVVDYADTMMAWPLYPIASNATWQTGDFNFDGVFDAQDLVWLPQLQGAILIVK